MFTVYTESLIWHIKKTTNYSLFSLVLFYHEVHKSITETAQPEPNLSINYSENAINMRNIFIHVLC